MRRPLPPELIVLGDQLEFAARRAVGRRRTHRQMVLNAITSIAIAVPLVAGALGSVGAAPVPEISAPNSPSYGAKGDEIPPRLLTRVGHPSDDVGVLLALGEGPRRYHQILSELHPISEKVLTQTLRTMERDGLIARHVHAEVPPRVEYTLTRLGASMAGPMKALGNWAIANADQVELSREHYDAVNA
jgi:DNA-binding HxlR family transcriptional regulator